MTVRLSRMGNAVPDWALEFDEEEEAMKIADLFGFTQDERAALRRAVSGAKNMPGLLFDFTTAECCFGVVYRAMDGVIYQLWEVPILTGNHLKYSYNWLCKHMSTYGRWLDGA